MPFIPPNPPLSLYTAEQTRQLDRCAIEQHQIPGFELMKRAGRAAYRALRRRWPQVNKLTLLCGGGNNGGDAIVVAVLAREQQLEVELLLVGGEQTRDKLRGEALQALQWAEQQGVKVENYDPDRPWQGQLLVDGLLGTGLRGEVRDPFRTVIERVNASGLPVLALDIPSGLCADSGAVLGCAVRADLTISFIGLNRGLLTHQGGDHCGELLFDSLKVPEAVYQQLDSNLSLIDSASLLRRLGQRRRSAHKGDYGHLLVVGGDYGMAGAVQMAATAGLRAGAGLVSLATRPEHLGLAARQPELMAHAVPAGQELQPLVPRASVILVGPGLGQGAWGEQLLGVVQQQQLALVIDADGLNLLARGGLVEPARRENWVLTPHPGEAARLLGCSTAEVQADRFQAVNQLQQRYGGVVILKGAGTLVCDGCHCWLCCRGNPGMASGGMGDVLAGVVAALLAQGLKPSEAARLAVEVHACAADLLAERYGERGLLATDLIPEIRRLLNPRLSGLLKEEQDV